MVTVKLGYDQSGNELWQSNKTLNLLSQIIFLLHDLFRLKLFPIFNEQSWSEPILILDYRPIISNSVLDKYD